VDQSADTATIVPMERVLYEVKKVIVGQDHLLERLAVALLARGHLLVEGVPGLAKTMAIKTLAGAIGGDFQAHPVHARSRPGGSRRHTDLQPEDGRVQYFRWARSSRNLLLADEINRAPAKVQSALLEVMQERQVTIGRETFKVPDPFLVLATQNPIETEGTYALPEAQVDRFMLKVLVGYPSSAEEFVIVERMTQPLGAVQEVLSTKSLLELQKEADSVYVDPALIAVRRAPGNGHSSAQVARYGGAGAIHHLRGKPASVDKPDPHGPRSCLRSGPGLRPSPGRARHGTRRHAPPSRPVVRGALRQT